jgi:hypothetical protein
VFAVAAPVGALVKFTPNPTKPLVLAAVLCA